MVFKNALNCKDEKILASGKLMLNIHMQKLTAIDKILLMYQLMSCIMILKINENNITCYLQSINKYYY